MDSRLERVYRQVPKSTCPPGCGKCCGIIFPSLAEIRNIKDWCEGHRVEYRDFSDIIGLDCPYLTTQKECLIYPVRPFLCRLFGVSENLPCPLRSNYFATALNHPQTRALYKAIYLHGKEKPRTEKHKKLLNVLFDQIEEQAK